MPKRAVFLDRDGTINVDKHYLYKITDFEYLPGIIKALEMMQDKGLAIVIITNQSGISRGLYSEKDYETLNKWMIADLQNHGISIAATYHCPHGPEEQCNCRKPRLGLFTKAACDLDLDIDRSFVIGDKERDVEICKTSGARGFIIYSNQTKKDGNIEHIQGGLYEAAKRIMQDMEKEGI